MRSPSYRKKSETLKAELNAAICVELHAIKDSMGIDYNLGSIKVPDLKSLRRILRPNSFIYGIAKMCGLLRKYSFLSFRAFVFLIPSFLLNHSSVIH